MNAKPTLSLDWDGVINPYSRGYLDGTIYDPHPVVGTRDALMKLYQDHRLVITTARSDLDAVRDALKNWGLDMFIDEVTNSKVPAIAYIDDRGIAFKNWDQAQLELDKIKGIT